MNGLPRRAVARALRRQRHRAPADDSRSQTVRGTARTVRPCSQLIHVNAAPLRVACAVQFVSHRTLEGERDDFEVTDVVKHLVACGCVGLLLATPMKGTLERRKP
jgi:hypothetical protein